MTRNEFLKKTKRFVLFCASGWRALPEKTPSAGYAGPCLEDGFEIKPSLFGADVYYNGAKMFTVNRKGKTLMEAADGSANLDAVIKNAGLEETASDAAMFFVCLGMAGYLKNRVEIEIYENKDEAEFGE